VRVEADARPPAQPAHQVIDGRVAQRVAARLAPQVDEHIVAVFSELKMIMNFRRSLTVSGCVADSCDQELNVVIVDSSESVPEIDGYPISQACCDPQHSLLAAGAGQ
jgi:hypothetical protein